jgi:hypothetical protein
MLYFLLPFDINLPGALVWDFDDFVTGIRDWDGSFLLMRRREREHFEIDSLLSKGVLRKIG